MWRKRFPLLDRRSAWIKVARFGLLITVPIFISSRAFSQSPASGTALITAEALEGFPSNRPMTIEPASDSDLNSRLAAVIRQELASGNTRQNGGAAGLTLRFATAMSNLEEATRRPTVELEGQGGNRGRSSVTGVLTLPLAKKDPKQQTPASTPNVRLRFDVLSADGNTVWVGEAIAARGSADRYSVLARLVPLLLERLGKSTTDEIVPFE